MKQYDTLENFINQIIVQWDGSNKPSKITMELDENGRFYKTKIYLKVKYNDEIHDAIIETKVNMLNQFEMVYDTDKDILWTITIPDENE